MPFAAARSLGSVSSAVAEGVSLMAENEAGLSAETSSGGSRGTMSAPSIPGKRAFGKISRHSQEITLSAPPRGSFYASARDFLKINLAVLRISK
jgi:hypothetical protein